MRLDRPLLLEREDALDADRPRHRGGGPGAGWRGRRRGAGGHRQDAVLQAARAGCEARDLRVLRARGALLEREHGFGVVRQLLEPTLAALAPTEHDDVLAGAGGPRGRHARPRGQRAVRGAGPGRLVHRPARALLAVREPGGAAAARARRRRPAVGRHALRALPAVPARARGGAAGRDRGDRAHGGDRPGGRARGHAGDRPGGRRRAPRRR